MFELKSIFDTIELFNDFEIMPKVLYDYERCNTKFKKPCPYYYGALSSLMLPILFAVITVLITACALSATSFLYGICSKWSIQGMFLELS